MLLTCLNYKYLYKLLFLTVILFLIFGGANKSYANKYGGENYYFSSHVLHEQSLNSCLTGINIQERQISFSTQEVVGKLPFFLKYQTNLQIGTDFKNKSQQAKDFDIAFTNNYIDTLANLGSGWSHNYDYRLFSIAGYYFLRLPGGTTALFTNRNNRFLPLNMNKSVIENKLVVSGDFIGSTKLELYFDGKKAIFERKSGFSMSLVRHWMITSLITENGEEIKFGYSDWNNINRQMFDYVGSRLLTSISDEHNNKIIFNRINLSGQSDKQYDKNLQGYISSVEITNNTTGKQKVTFNYQSGIAYVGGSYHTLATLVKTQSTINGIRYYDYKNYLHKGMFPTASHIRGGVNIPILFKIRDKYNTLRQFEVTDNKIASYTDINKDYGYVSYNENYVDSSLHATMKVQPHHSKKYSIDAETYHVTNNDNEITFITDSATSCLTLNGEPIKKLVFNKVKGTIKSVADKKGISKNFIYDSHNRLTTLTEAAGTNKQRITKYTYSKLSNGKDNLTNTPNTVTQPHLTVTNELNARGQIIKQTQQSNLPNSQTKTSHYAYYEDASKPTFGLLKSVNGPRTDINDVHGYAYDNYGNLTADAFYVTHAGKQKRYTLLYSGYNSAGKPTYVTQANGNTTKYTYDTGFRVTSETLGKGIGSRFKSDGISTRYAYDGLGRKIKETLPDGETLTYTYDSINRLTKTTRANGDYERYVYHPTNELYYKATYNKANQLTDYYVQTLDKNGRIFLTRTGTSANHNIQLNYYDANGNVITKKTLAPKDNKTYLTTKIDYDALNRPYRITNPKGEVQTITYDLADNINSHKAANGSGSGLLYTDTSQKRYENNSDFSRLDYRYNQAGDTTYKKDARGAYCTYSGIDQLGRLRAESCNIASSRNALFYTADIYDYDRSRYGRLDNVWSNSKGVANNKAGYLGTNTHYSYDNQDRITRKTQQAGLAYKITNKNTTLNINYAYSKGGKLTRVSLPSGKTLSYQYNNIGQVSRITLNNSPLMTNLNYDAANRLTHWQWGNGITTNQNYNNTTGNLSQINTTNGSTSLFKLNYSYYLNSQIKSQKINSKQTHNYYYDNLGQLTREVSPNYNHHYNYDNNGNRTIAPNQRLSYQTNTNLIHSYQQNKQNQGISHACTGVLKLNSLGKQGYDYKGRRTWEHGTGYTAFMQYNHNNERTFKYVNGQIRLYIYDEASHLIGEYTADGKAVVEYAWLGDKPIAALYANNQIVYLLTDHQNKPRRGVDAKTKQLVWAWDPDAFGVYQPYLAKVEVNLRFPGQYYDSHSGLYYNHNRYYSPKLGRYIEPDPIGLEGGLNPYVYAGNDPVNLVDPSGLESQSRKWYDISRVGPTNQQISDFTGISVNSLISAHNMMAGFNQMWTFGLSDHIAGVPPQPNATSTKIGQFVGFGVGLATGESYASGGKYLNSLPNAAAQKTGGGLTKVTSWAEEGITPTLERTIADQPRWVMKGDATLSNFLRTGLWGPSYPPFRITSNVPFRNSVTGYVPTSNLVWPKGWESFKGIFGQRIIQK